MIISGEINEKRNVVVGSMVNKDGDEDDVRLELITFKK
jgi:hypothetical protein